MNDQTGAVETSSQRSGGTEEDRRKDGAGRPNDPIPGSEGQRGNLQPKVEAPHAAEEVWTPQSGTQKTDPSGGGQAAANRGQPASTGSGPVTGSGAGAGGGAPEDIDTDPQSGGGAMPNHAADRPATGGDAPSHGSR